MNTGELELLKSGLTISGFIPTSQSSVPTSASRGIADINAYVDAIVDEAGG